MKMTEKDPESLVSQQPKSVEDVASKEAAPKVQAFWLFVWMIKYVSLV